jgi:hypothetical protein
MCRISPVSEDWVEKGCHIHIRGTEVALRPNHLGGIVVKKIFRSTPDERVDAATVLLLKRLQDPKWRKKLIDRLNGAMVFLLGVEGERRTRARGKLAEMHRLIIALQLMGPT